MNEPELPEGFTAVPDNLDIDPKLQAYFESQWRTFEACQEGDRRPWNCKPHFRCRECYRDTPIGNKGKASKNGKPYDVCVSCCLEEQKRQFYSEM